LIAWRSGPLGPFFILTIKNYKTEEFIKKAEIVHDHYYSYNNAVYIKNDVPILITCPKHGEFKQLPKTHLRGRGCTQCNGGIRITTDQFIQSAKYAHDDRYDYTNTIYINQKTKLNIICPIHGNNLIMPNSHLVGVGCTECAKIRRAKIRVENSKLCFEETAIIKHGNKYDYSNVSYKNAKQKVKILCPQHGEFLQTPNDHLRGYGCPTCGSKARSEIDLRNGISNYFSDATILFNQRIVPSRISKTKLEIDIWIPDFKIAVEYNGIQHYTYNNFFHRGQIELFEQQQAYDNEKKLWADKNNVKLIVIPYWQYNQVMDEQQRLDEKNRIISEIADIITENSL